jgi:hypothetical protein
MSSNKKNTGWYGPFYFDRSDPRVFVPKRLGWGWTVNFARPTAYLVVLAPLELRPAGSGTGARDICGALASSARERFGDSCRQVFSAWGITRSTDFGRIVVALAGAKLITPAEAITVEWFEDRGLDAVVGQGDR